MFETAVWLRTDIFTGVGGTKKSIVHMSKERTCNLRLISCGAFAGRFESPYNFIVLVAQRCFCKVKHFNKSESLIRPIEAQSYTVGRKCKYDRLEDRFGSGICQV